MRENNVEAIVNLKQDMSPYLVHLMKDDETGLARDKLISIINEKMIKANSYDCLFRQEIVKNGEGMKRFFRTISFTETPLHELSRLTKDELKENLNISLSPYGIAFKKEFIALHGGEPVIYVYNTKHERWWKEQYAMQINKNSMNQDSIFHLVNRADNQQDWYWEREWRIRGNLDFTPEDIAYLILPDLPIEDILEFHSKIHSNTINIYIPGSKKYYSFDEDRHVTILKSDGTIMFSKDGGVNWDSCTID